MSAEAIVWKGAEQLAGQLVPIDSLEPFPDNPRLGDIAAVAEILERFGQLIPLVVDGNRIIAGHQRVLAARGLGWTHLARVDHRFLSENEQRAFLVADNHISELGGYDEPLLLAQLQQLAEGDALEGTGYTNDDLEEMLAALQDPGPQPAESPLDRRGQRSHRDPGRKEVVLDYSDEQFHEFELWAGIVQRELGTTSSSVTVFEAMRIAAQQLNA